VEGCTVACAPGGLVCCARAPLPVRNAPASTAPAHLLLMTFAVLSSALFVKSWQIIILPLPIAMEIAITGFEVLVAVLQAFIFTILTAVYIGGSLHPEH